MSATIDRAPYLFPAKSWSIMVVLAIVMTAFGCSRSREHELETIKARVDAHRLQAWATNILNQYPDATSLYPYFPGIAADSTMVILSNPPAFLNELQMGRMGPMIHVSGAGPDSKRRVSLLYADSFGFGGPGHCVDVGGQTFRLATNSECVEWIPGVYYRYVHSP